MSKRNSVNRILYKSEKRNFIAYILWEFFISHFVWKILCVQRELNHDDLFCVSSDSYESFAFFLWFSFCSENITEIYWVIGMAPAVDWFEVIPFYRLSLLNIRRIRIFYFQNETSTLICFKRERKKETMKKYQ